MPNGSARHEPYRTELTATCAGCTRNRIVMGRYPLGGYTEDEKRRFAYELLAQRGWGVVQRDDDPKHVDVLCPVCLNKHKATVTLPPHEAGLSRCRKCGHRKIGTIFCDGRSRPCQFRAIDTDHLHRQCGRCGYEWITACRDSQTSVKESDDDHDSRQLSGDAGSSEDVPDPGPAAPAAAH